MLKKIVIFGVGLIGGSFARALRQAGAVEQIVGVGRTAAVLQRAKELGIIDVASTSVEEALRDADLVLLAAPVAQTAVILESIKPYLQPGTVVTDAGSIKGEVVTTARAVLGDKIAQFVPGHPIAGLEANGPEAAIPRSVHRQEGGVDAIGGKLCRRCSLGSASLAAVRRDHPSVNTRKSRRSICCCQSFAAFAGVCTGRRYCEQAAC